MTIIKCDLSEDVRFYVAASAIPQAGLGLFAAQDMKEGDKLDVHGVSIAKESHVNTCTNYARNYKFQDPGNSNRSIIPLGWAAMANYQNDESLQNARIENDGENLFLLITRDVQKDEEIFIHYGNDWCGIDPKLAEFIWRHTGKKVGANQGMG